MWKIYDEISSYLVDICFYKKKSINSFFRLFSYNDIKIEELIKFDYDNMKIIEKRSISRKPKSKKEIENVNLIIGLIEIDLDKVKRIVESYVSKIGS